MLDFRVLDFKGMRIMMLQLSVFYYRTSKPSRFMRASRNLDKYRYRKFYGALTQKERGTLKRNPFRNPPP